jgi:hypothetical protein
MLNLLPSKSINLTMQEDSPTSNRYSPPSLFTTCPRYSSLNLLLKRSQQLLEDSGGQVCRVQEDNPTSPVAFISWEDICQSKDNGGLGIRDLHTVNKSLIIRNAYDIATNKNPLLTAVLKSKYFHTSSFWTANRYGPKSIFWSSILQVKKDLIDNATYQLHAGNASIGQHLGVQSRIQSMITSCCRSPLCRYQP